jgi:putative ABC transport system ATP-binding protein
MYNLSEKKLYKPFSNEIDQPQIRKFLSRILSYDKKFLLSSLIYSMVISLLSLAVPVSVQLLINSVSYTAMLQPLMTIGVVLFILLAFSSMLYAIQFYVIEIFQRRFFARSSCEVALSLLNAQYKTFESGNQKEMVNRFFETINIQKAVPKFITDSFTIFLRAIVGLTLIAFYHPLFLLFSIFIILSVVVIWHFYYKEAQVSAFYESRRKLDLVGWLEDIAGVSTLFKSQRGYDYAKYKTDFLVAQYLKERKRHFANLFTQNILLLSLYVVASSALLMIGGYLVLKEQLTIGQLVAAELVLSIILYEISRFGRDFSNFYDLVASCEKLSQFQNIPLEEKKLQSVEITARGFSIDFSEVYYVHQKREFNFNFNFESGKNYIISTKGFSTKKAIIDLMNGFAAPLAGAVNFNGENIENFNKYLLRNHIGIIDNSELIEGLVGEYLYFNNKEISLSEISGAIKTVGLEKNILQHPDGLNLRMLPSGFPFSESEKILLKIARILIQKPKVIIITEVLDMLVLKARQNILNYLTKNPDVTLIYFSHRSDGMMDFDKYLFIDKKQHFEFASMQELENFEIKYFENGK